MNNEDNSHLEVKMDPGIMFYLSVPWLTVCILGLMVVATNKEKRRSLPVNRLDAQMALSVIAILMSYKVRDEIAIWFWFFSIIILFIIRITIMSEKTRNA